MEFRYARKCGPCNFLNLTQYLYRGDALGHGRASINETPPGSLQLLSRTRKNTLPSLLSINGIAEFPIGTEVSSSLRGFSCTILTGIIPVDAH